MKGAVENKVMVTVLPLRKQLVANRGLRLFDVLVEAGFFQNRALCSGAGVCGGCEVLLIDGKQKVRVKACQKVLESDCTIEILPEPVGVSFGTEQQPSPKGFFQPNWKQIRLCLSDGKTRSEFERFQKAVFGAGLEIAKPLMPVLRQLVEAVSPEDTVSVVVCEKEVLAVSRLDHAGGIYGIAVDLGTTTLVGYLFDMTTGRWLGTASMINPQSAVAADVVSRIQLAAEDPSGLRKMGRMLRQGLAELVEKLLGKAKIDRTEVYELVLAGNTCMQQLLQQVSVSGLSHSPYRPATTEALRCRASDLEVNFNEMARIWFFPCIGGFVGGDTVAMMLACFSAESGQISEAVLAIDIGTNCEIVLETPDLRLACSAAAGPAFEGGAVYQGMRAGEGAIDRVWLDGDVQVHVIGDVSPQGICGSGLVDAVATLLACGMMDDEGRMMNCQEAGELNLDPSLTARLVQTNGGQSFRLSGSGAGTDNGLVVLTQLDIRQLQLAKAAIRAAVEVLTEQAGIRMQEIGKVFLAGAFGNYLNIENASKLGIIPADLAGRVVPAGNAAGAGACQALLFPASRARAEQMAKSVQHVSVADHPDFQALFLGQLSFKENNIQ